MTNDSNDNKNTNEVDPAKEKMRAEFDALRAELEVANYGVGKHGRARRKISRQESKIRTIKRKSLEIEDAKEAAVKSIETKRMRGSKAALEDDVIQGSLIFGKALQPDRDRDDDDDDDSEYVMSECETDDDNSDDGEERRRYNLYADELNIDIEDDEDDDEDSTDECNEEHKKISSSELSSNAKESALKSTAAKLSGKNIAKTMYKLKNFKSYKLAQRHGEALGAHARGLNVLAVDKLKDVAAAAPVAPQIYSSLGLVYESMLREETHKAKQKDSIVKGSKGATYETQKTNNNSETLEDVHERIKLAKKTFASYHVAALLCKMDFSLWVRAGDAALAIANLHSYCLSLSPNLSVVEKSLSPSSTNKTPLNRGATIEDYVQFHKAQKTKWLEEAKEDFLTADNLHPPGISVPSKLAYTHMELGNLSEALTILTDIKNKFDKEIESSFKEGSGNRTELEKSFSTWMLYADLMLLIGHECKQWNNGIYTNDNYMFKRWLRKHSITFDWQERRFQALCMALEAAAGTKSCGDLLDWIMERARIMKVSGVDASAAKGRWHIHDGYETEGVLQHAQSGSKSDQIEADPLNTKEYHEQNGTHSQLDPQYDDKFTSLSDLKHKFDNDRCALLSSNKSELAAFDKCTGSMDLIDSQVAKQRETERNLLIEKHKQALVNLAVKYQQDKSALSQGMHVDGHEIEKSERRHLPLSAPCAIVCDIAFQLVKQCLAMNIYRGGALACEAVSSYLKERALRYEDRSNKWKRLKEREEVNWKPVLQLEKEAYDTMDQENNEDDEESLIILSDDEDFESAQGENIINMMKNGVLPPDLQVLHGLCLIGEGTLPFLAIKMLDSINFLDETDSVDFELVAKCDQSENFSQRLFRKAMVEPMNKLETFAFASDVLKKANKEGDWAERLLPIFDNYVQELDNQNSFTLLRNSATQQTIMGSMKRKNYIKVLYSTYRMRISVANSCIIGTSESMKKAYDLTMTVIDDVARYLDAFWSTKSDGNPVPETIEMLNIVSSAFNVIMVRFDASANLEIRDFQTTLEKLKIFVAMICRMEFHNIFSSKSTLLIDNLRHFPIPCNWQSDEHAIMSRCAYNLSVAGAISSFSGWENDEFALNLLSRHWKDTFFGVYLKGKYVAGYISSHIEKYLSRIWQLIDKVIPTLTSLDFDNAISNVKQVEWFTTAMKNLKSFEDKPIATYGEESALSILLMFAQTALALAKVEEDKQKKESLVKHALSLILPPTQFCLDQSLWESTLGTKGADDNAEWQIFSVDNDVYPPKSKVSKTKIRNPPSKVQQKSKQQPSKSAKVNITMKSPFSKLIKISADMLLKEWNGKSNFEEVDDENETEEIVDSRLNRWTNSISGKSMLSMKKLDYSVKKLRQCITINSLQKASLQVALVLLEVAATKECENPFICLSQAAIFAAQGPKGGNNDEDFKRPLPREEDCTAEEALQILGRADCLRALHFTNEAIFLCSYVARVCCLHRDRQETDHPWTPRWRIIGIMTYTISVGIDSSICSIMQGDEMKAMLDSWDKSVKAEIGRGRSDAIALQKSFGRRNSSFETKFSSLKVGDNREGNLDKGNESEESWNEDEDDMDQDDYDESYEGYDDDHYESVRSIDDGELDDYASDEEIEDAEYATESNTPNVIERQSHVIPPLPPIPGPFTQPGTDFATIPSVEI